jgi:hypothetical protein
MSRDLKKLKGLIRYVAWNAGKQHWCEATNLYKVLWFADARQFVRTQKPITRAIYIREKDGPVPKQALTARKQLEEEGAIKVSKEGEATRIIALHPPDLSIFTADELKNVDDEIEQIDRNHTKDGINEESHDYAWGIAAVGEELPLHAILANRIRKPDEREVKRLRRRAKELGLI